MDQKTSELLSANESLDHSIRDLQAINLLLDSKNEQLENAVSLLDQKNNQLSFTNGLLDKRNDELRAANNSLDHSNEELKEKNDELDEFTYVASHDLQEPVRKLISFSQLLKEDVGDDLSQDAEEDLGSIVDAASRMQKLPQLRLMSL